jgi:FkbM family methyltransferase
LDIGANDGFELSNTAYLEKHFGWRGLLVEANSKYSESLKKRTRSQVVIKAISREAGTADFVDGGLYGGLVDAMDMTHQDRLSAAPQIQVECITLGELLAEYDSPHRIDFVSIDVEGAELPIVEQLVKVDRRFTCGCIEYNARVSDYAKMKCLLEGAGYRVCWEGQTGHDLFFIEESHAQLVY